MDRRGIRKLAIIREEISDQRKPTFSGPTSQTRGEKLMTMRSSINTHSTVLIKVTQGI